MQAHQERVVQEQTELNDKLVKLSAFLKGEVFRSLDSNEQQRLTAQADHMHNYNEVLKMRIEAF